MQEWYDGMSKFGASGNFTPPGVQSLRPKFHSHGSSWLWADPPKLNETRYDPGDLVRMISTQTDTRIVRDRLRTGQYTGEQRASFADRMLLLVRESGGRFNVQMYFHALDMLDNIITSRGIMRHQVYRADQMIREDERVEKYVMCKAFSFFEEEEEKRRTFIRHVFDNQTSVYAAYDVELKNYVLQSTPTCLDFVHVFASNLTFEEEAKVVSILASMRMYFDLLEFPASILAAAAVYFVKSSQFSLSSDAYLADGETGVGPSKNRPRQPLPFYKKDSDFAMMKNNIQLSWDDDKFVLCGLNNPRVVFDAVQAIDKVVNTYI
jgi:hypothetical protein